MRLRDFTIKPEYRTLVDDMTQDFYLPLLSSAVMYQRAVGFFSSSVLALIAPGINGLWQRGGKIQIVTSPNLSDEDIAAIRDGYTLRGEIVKNALLRELYGVHNSIEKKRLNLLANLIADGVMDLKIAITQKGNGIFHDKIGVITDCAGDSVAFAGSMNETATALSFNHEQIEVFCSWKNDEQAERAKRLGLRFGAIWTGNEAGIEIIDVPELSDEIISRYRTGPIEEYDEKEDGYGALFVGDPQSLFCRIPPEVSLHDYQIEAIDNWERAGWRGVFDMATGTGKTYTALGAVARLSAHLNSKLAVFIVAPFQHLVEQWVEDIEMFGMKPIVGHSASRQKDWLRRLNNAIRDQKVGARGCEGFCFVCTNASFASKKVQLLLEKACGNILLIVDEAHNFGAINLSKCLNDRFAFRLALSATIERHCDEEGTAKIFGFFSAKCIEYGLDRAIAEHRLTPYKYYPVVVSLTSNERAEYERLSDEIKRCLRSINGHQTLNDRGKRLALLRARIVAGAENKITALEEVISPYTDKAHILVYCGATRLSEDSQEFWDLDDEDRRQISVVSSLLGNKLGMKVSHFTSREPMEERANLKIQFAGGDLQALVAIKCLDEGVNIPAIKTAFILASTTNPKEYIQRRGRVLRLAPGKDFAEIYDFITLPCPLNEGRNLIDERRDVLMGLVRRELARAENFVSIAKNAASGHCALLEIKNAFRIFETIHTTDEEFS